MFSFDMKKDVLSKISEYAHDIYEECSEKFGDGGEISFEQLKEVITKNDNITGFGSIFYDYGARERVKEDLETVVKYYNDVVGENIQYDLYVGNWDLIEVTVRCAIVETLTEDELISALRMLEYIE